MNSPRSIETKQSEITPIEILKQSPNVEKLRQLQLKNESLEKELIKSQIKIKKLEEIIKSKQEKEYIVFNINKIDKK